MWYLHTMEVYSAIKRSTPAHNMDTPQKHVERKKPDANAYIILCRSISVKFKNRQKESGVRESKIMMTFVTDGRGHSIEWEAARGMFLGEWKRSVS